MRAPDRHTLVRHTNERRVLEILFERGPVTRVEVSEIAGLSKPTVNAVVRGLVDSGLLREDGKTLGRVGRSAQVYALDDRSRLVAGVDLGGTKVRVAIANLLGEVIAEITEPTDLAGGRQVLDQIVRTCHDVALRAGLDWELVDTIGISAPGVLDPATDRVDLAFNIPGFNELHLRRDLESRLGREVMIDNDVNLAALGEQWKGLAAHTRNFVFLAIGTGIGMGLVVDGRLVHGHRGAAGEIGFMPVGGDPLAEPALRRRGALEESAATDGVIAIHERLRAAKTDPTSARPSSVAEIYAAAGDGDAVALQTVEEQARLIALAAMAVTSVVDPEMFVLGGGIGANPLLLQPVRRYLAELSPFEVRVETSALGDRTSVLGALALALGRTKEKIFARSDIDG